MHESATLGSDADETDLQQLAYSVKQAAKALAMGERTLWALVRSEKIRSYTVGASRRISRAALLEFIEQQETKA